MSLRLGHGATPPTALENTTSAVKVHRCHFPSRSGLAWLGLAWPRGTLGVVVVHWLSRQDGSVLGSRPGSRRGSLTWLELSSWMVGQVLQEFKENNNTYVHVIK